MMVSVDRNRTTPGCDVTYVPCSDYTLEIKADETDWYCVTVKGRQGSASVGYKDWQVLAESKGWCTAESALEEGALILAHLVKASPLGKARETIARQLNA